jgi:hypothetical protein
MGSAHAGAEDGRMCRVKRLRVATDFSRPFDIAFRYALDLAEGDGASICLLRDMPIGP